MANVKRSLLIYYINRQCTIIGLQIQYAINLYSAETQKVSNALYSIGVSKEQTEFFGFKQRLKVSVVSVYIVSLFLLHVHSVL